MSKFIPKAALSIIVSLAMYTVFTDTAVSSSFAKNQGDSVRTYLPTEKGTLIVYTDIMKENSDAYEYSVYSPYTIKAENGTVTEVKESRFAPASITLTPGKYIIITKAGKNTRYSVVIEAGKITEVR